MSHVEDGTSSTPHVEDGMSSMSHVEGSNEDWQDEHIQQSRTAAASVEARQRRRIAQLEEKLETLESGRAVKERQANYYMAQGRAIRRIVALFDNIEDLVNENDRRYDDEGDQEYTLDQDRLQIGYHALTSALPWFHQKGSEMEYDDYAHLLKILRQGADGARGDDTSKLKALVSDWINRDFKPDPPVDPDDKHSRGFTNDVCGMLLCPNRARLEKPNIFPSRPTYEGYTANPDDLEEGLFKGKILLQAYKAVFTSPSSAKDVEGDGDGTDIIENNRRARRSFSGLKVKKHVAQIIKMRKVTPRSIAYIACQVRFALSSVTSWRSADGDFDYVQFWRTIVDFFEKPPGRGVHRRINNLLEWWTRKVFGRSHRDGISDTTKASMSVNALARQRAQHDDADLDSS